MLACICLEPSFFHGRLPVIKPMRTPAASCRKLHRAHALPSTYPPKPYNIYIYIYVYTCRIHNQCLKFRTMLNLCHRNTGKFNTIKPQPAPTLSREAPHESHLGRRETGTSQCQEPPDIFLTCALHKSVVSRHRNPSTNTNPESLALRL